MEEEISERFVTMLNVLKGKLLLSSLGQVFVIKDFTYREGTKKGLFGGEKKTLYLTGITIYTYHEKGKFIGIVKEDTAVSMLNRYDFYVMRQQWIDFCDTLKAFGFEIKPININDKEAHDR